MAEAVRWGEAVRRAEALGFRVELIETKDFWKWVLHGPDGRMWGRGVRFDPPVEVMEDFYRDGFLDMFGQSLLNTLEMIRRRKK